MVAFSSCAQCDEIDCVDSSLILQAPREDDGLTARLCVDGDCEEVTLRAGGASANAGKSIDWEEDETVAVEIDVFAADGSSLGSISEQRKMFGRTACRCLLFNYEWRDGEVSRL